MLLQANYEDITTILEIIEDAKHRMKKDQLIQWQNGYPNYQSISDSYNQKQLFKLVENDKIVACCVINDTFYDTYPKTYIAQEARAIHTVAVASDFLGKGYGLKLYQSACNYIKAENYKLAVVDTYSENQKMKNLIVKSGFTKIGNFELIDNCKQWVLYEKEL